MKKFAIALVLAGLTAGSVGISADGKDRPPSHTTLDALRAQPDAWLNAPITFEGRFHRLGEVYQPFFSPFDSFSFQNFAAWDVSSDLNSKDVFLDHCATLYVDREMMSPTMRSLSELKPYQRFTATGVVRAVFAGKPFIEVTKVEPHDWWKFWLTADDFHREAFGH